MKTIYKSKVGLSFIIPTVLLCAFLLFASVYYSEWMIAAILALVLSYAVFASTCTLYTIENRQLVVQVGSLYKRHIDISSISKINEVVSIINAPATSYHRLEILYANHSYVLVSPINREDFVQQLQQANPGIVFNQKK